MAILDDDDLSETGHAGELFNGCVNLFWKILVQATTAVTPADPKLLENVLEAERLGRKTLQKQRQLFEKLYFWGEGFIRQPLLDTVLEISAPLKWHLISLLSDVGRTLIALDEADVALGERLGVLNWNRFNTLRQAMDNPPPEGEPDEHRDRHTEALTTEISTSIGRTRSTNASTDIGTEITTPDLGEERHPDEYEFDNIGHLQHQADLETVLTSTTQLAGNFRVPEIPPADENGNRICTVCMHDLKRSVQTRTDWKRHVYHDLSPYSCTMVACKLSGRDTFASRREWVEHEFQQHLAERVWLCSACSARTATKESFIQHVERNHPEYNWIEERIAIEASESPSIAVFAQHVGRHLEQIALVVLQIRSFGDSEQEDDDERGSEDSDHSEENGLLAMEGRYLQDDDLDSKSDIQAPLSIQASTGDEHVTMSSTRNFEIGSGYQVRPRIQGKPSPKMRKFAVVGSRGTDKSALLTQFVDGIFVENYRPTIETTFSKLMRINGQDYAVEIVDTAGQVGDPSWTAIIGS
ncbi:GTP-binding protein [Paramyrothecium foliicola]|nr:GTP-binding protein [Paramyrothecium foliicola]